MAKEPTSKDLRAKLKKFESASKKFDTKLADYGKARDFLKKDGARKLTTINSIIKAMERHVPEYKDELSKGAKLIKDLEKFEKTSAKGAKIPKKLAKDIDDCFDNLDGLHTHLSTVPEPPDLETLKAPKMEIADRAEEMIPQGEEYLKEALAKAKDLEAYAQEKGITHDELNTIRTAHRWTEEPIKKLPQFISKAKAALKNCRALDNARLDAANNGQTWSDRKKLDDGLKELSMLNSAISELNVKTSRLPTAEMIKKHGERALTMNITNVHRG